MQKIEWYSALKTGKLTSHKRHIYNIEKYYWVKEQSLKNIQGYKSNMLHFGRGSAKEEVWWLSGLTKLTIEKQNEVDSRVSKSFQFDTILVDMCAFKQLRLSKSKWETNNSNYKWRCLGYESVDKKLVVTFRVQIPRIK